MKLAVLAGVALLVVGVAACSPSSTVSTTAKSDTTTTAATTAATTASASASAKAVAKVGSTITLKGQTAGNQLDITLVAVANSVTATDGFSTPPAGDRYYAVQWRINNTGTGAYDDAPSNGTKVADAQGQQYETDIVSRISAGVMMPAEVKVAPGSQALGWIVYDVPTGTTITAAQFSLSSGFGNTGQWAI